MRAASLGLVAVCAAGVAGWWNWASRCSTGCPGQSALTVREFTPPIESSPISVETLRSDDSRGLELVEVIDLPLLSEVPRNQPRELPAELFARSGEVTPVAGFVPADDFSPPSHPFADRVWFGWPILDYRRK